MNTPCTRNHAAVKRSTLALALITFLLLFVGLPRLSADDEPTKCQRGIEKAGARLDDAVRDHGSHSHEAEVP